MRVCAALAVAFAALSACAPAPTCRMGGGRSVPVSVVAVAGEVTRVPLAFPAPTNCALPEGTFTAAGTYTDATGQPAPVLIDGLAHDTRRGSASLAVVFTPPSPGAGELRVFVDPQLGLATIPVYVARDGRALRAVDEPRECAEPQRTAGGLVVCADGGVQVRRGSAVETFPQAQAALVIGHVVWLEHRDDGGVAFERLEEDDDGGLRRTHHAPVPTPRPVMLRYADADRFTSLGLTALPSPDGGLELVTTSGTSVSEATLSEPDRAWRWSSNRWCAADGGCFAPNSGARLVGVEASVWWEYARSALFVHRRPLADAGAVATIVPPTSVSAMRRADLRAVRRPTLTVPARGPGLFVLEWSPDGGGLLLTRFEETVELGQGPGSIAFALDGGLVRFYEL